MDSSTMMDESASDLSDIPSDNFEETMMDETDFPAAPEPLRMPPAKRQKLTETSFRDVEEKPEIDFDNASLSSDTSGEVPYDPSNLRAEDEEPTHEQVTVCFWDGCPVGDMGNMDRLVEHIHNEHIESNNRTKKYTCEWSDCVRKGLPHASAYALKAHMRSHTREKPFYCALPECDRSFTRSDALAKHMRTVHETEALRPSDPIPKTMQQQKRAGLKPPHGKAPVVEDAPETPAVQPPEQPQPEEITLTEEEAAMDPRELFRLMRRQLHWAEEDQEELQRQLEVAEAMRKQMWLEKEALLDQVKRAELDWYERRQVVLAAEAAQRREEEVRRAEAKKLDEAREREREQQKAAGAQGDVDMMSSPAKNERVGGEGMAGDGAGVDVDMPTAEYFTQEKVAQMSPRHPEEEDMGQEEAAHLLASLAAQA